MNKREFIQRTIATAAASSAVIMARVRHAAASIPPVQAWKDSVPATGVVYDDRYSDAREFALELNRRGAVLFPTGQDIGQLWYGILRQHLSVHSGQLAGLTPYSDLYLIQAMARELQMRVLYEGCHDCRGSSTISHRVRGECGGELTLALRSPDARWPTMLAQTLADSSLSGRYSPSWHTIGAHQPRAADHPGVLVSWLIGRPA